MIDKEHQAPWECTYAKEEKSKCKPGKNPKSDQEYFEILCLCILQAGLNWGLIRKNWGKYKNGFYDFEISKLAKSQTKELMSCPNVIRNNRKVEGIIYNAKEFQKIKKENGSFESFFKSLKLMKDKEVLKLLTKRFKHLGNYTAEYYLHSVGYWE
ncbi:MAG: DNA-3-methyladenine glycosylase I [Candidatus Heimdallarchaeota archaeon]